MKITTLTRRTLSASERTDIVYGWPHLIALAKFGVGRTLLVKDRSVLSVETIEGVTDAIHRAGNVCSGQFVVLLNTEGGVPEPVDTRILQAMVDSGAAALAVRRDYPFADREQTLKFAETHKIPIVEVI